MKFLRGLLVAAALLLSAVCVNAQDVKVAENIRDVMHSTFALYGQYKGTTHMLCTATAYEKTASGYHLITAGHCVVGDIPEGVKFFVVEEINVELAFQSVNVLKAEFNEKYDFAVLDLVTPRTYSIVPIDEETPFPAVGASTVNVNFTVGLAKQLSIGTVASERMTKDAANGECELCLNRYLVQEYAGPGASGSAVLDAGTGKIVGLVEAGFPGVTLGAIVIPMTTFHEFIVDGTTEINNGVRKSAAQREVKTGVFK